MGLSVIPNPVNAYIHFPLNRHLLGGQLKCDNICVIIMLQILPVDLQQLLVCAENIIETLQAFLLFVKKSLQKLL